ncbi:MAG: CvpA family protein [Clostridiales bacterium]|nr:CvpA family protein [Clostridiales bacterium]
MAIGWFVDLILLVIAVAFIVIAAKKGFVLSLLEWVGVFIAVFLAVRLSAPVADVLYESFVKTTVLEGLRENLPQNVSTMVMSEKIDAIMKAIPEFVLSSGKSLGIDAQSIADSVKSTGRLEGNTIELIEQNIVGPIVTQVVKLITVLVLMVVFIIIFKAIAAVINKMIKKVPFVGTANILLGGIVGIGKAVIVLCIVCALLQFSVSASESDKAVTETPSKATEAIMDSNIVSLVNDYNPIMKLFK